MKTIKDLISVKENGQIKKTDILKISSEVTKSKTPLKTFIIVKALETMIKEIISDKKFRESVKEDFLNQSGGALNKTQLNGVSIQIISNEKKNTLNREYEFSSELKSLQNEIEIMRAELKSKETLLKEKKMIEINSGTAKETISSKHQPENSLNEFDIKITFQN